MDTHQQLEEKFWKSLTSDRIVMLGIDGVEDGHSRPMTAIVEHEGGPIWFFTGKSNAMIEHLERNQRAMAAFSAKDHELFASIHGNLSQSDDRAVVDRLWNPFISAWFEGKDDPNLVLLRFDAENAEVWLNESNMLAGIKMLFRADAGKNYPGKAGVVNLH